VNNGELLNNINCEIEALGYRNTPAIRAISKKYFEYVSKKSTEEIFSLCTILLETRLWSNQLIAYDWAFRLKKHYTTETYTLFETWLFNYINDWYDCDDFCCHAFGYLIYEFPDLATKVFSWTKSDNFAVRRSAVVVFIYSIRRGQLIEVTPWNIIEKLMHDEHYLVLKGYGWLLKEMTKNFKAETIQFLQKYEAEMPRLSFRYAIEKLTKGTFRSTRRDKTI
jgi:3-methyladenine DNA glycosylase AlkD